MNILFELQELRSPWLTKIFEFFTLLGEELVVLAVIGCLYWCVNKRLAYRICFAYFVSGLLVQALKITFRIPRPWIQNSKLIPVESALETATGYSFPSGHTQSATALFTSLASFVQRAWLEVLFVFVAVMVGISRLYLGVHTFWDVLVSFGLTVLFVLFLPKVLNEIEAKENLRFPVALVLIGISMGVLLYSFLLHENGIIETKYVSDCCKAAGAGLGFAIGWYVEGRFIRFQEGGWKKDGKHLAKQLLKLIVGLAVTLLLKVGLKSLMGDYLFADALRYFFMVIWAMVGFPYCIKKFF